MADLTSTAARQAIAGAATPYFVRVDVPIATDQPETRVKAAGQSDIAGCSTFCEQVLSEESIGKDDLTNIQVRVWHRTDTAPESAQLLLDRTCLPWAVAEVMKEFANEVDHQPLAPLTSSAEAERRDLGGPFETEHALLVAINRRADPVED